MAFGRVWSATLSVSLLADLNVANAGEIVQSTLWDFVEKRDDARRQPKLFSKKNCVAARGCYDSRPLAENSAAQVR